MRYFSPIGMISLPKSKANRLTNLLTGGTLILPQSLLSQGTSKVCMELARQVD